jgi:hypothetical protein
MKIHLTLFVIVSAVSAVQGQVMVETGHSGQTRDGALIVYGSDNLRYSIPYEKIKGSPFWKDMWYKAFLFDHRDTAMGSYKARFNFATNEVHYIDKKGEEKVPLPGSLNAVVFMDPADSTRIATVFKTNIPEVKKKASCKSCFIQELNQGETKLLKITQRQLKSADSLFGTLKTYYFADAEEYYVQAGEQYNRLRRLNKDAFFTFIPGGSSYTNWIKEKGLRFNKENDYIVFLEHYNATHKKD